MKNNNKMRYGSIQALFCNTIILYLSSKSNMFVNALESEDIISSSSRRNNQFLLKEDQVNLRQRQGNSRKEKDLSLAPPQQYENNNNKENKNQEIISKPHRKEESTHKEQHDDVLQLLKTGEISKYKVNNIQYKHHRTRRKLDEESFKGIKNHKTEPIKIEFDTGYLAPVSNVNTALYFNEKRKIQTIRNKILPRAQSIWKGILSVVPIDSYTIPFETVCKDYITVPLEYKEQGLSDVDLLIFVDAMNCNQFGGDGNTLAFTSICVLDPFTDRPIVGRMTYCLDEMEMYATSTTTTSQQINKQIKISLHEIGHILGMQVQLFPWFRSSQTGIPLTTRPHALEEVHCTDGSFQNIIKPSNRTIQPVITRGNVLRYAVVTPTVVTITQNQFNCYDNTILIGAYLENQDNAQFCFGNHWDERFYFSELMGPYYTDIIQNNVLSPLTLALLEDSGWYMVDYTKVEGNSPFGYGSGCDFIEQDCIQQGNVMTAGKDAFCNRQIYFNNNAELLDTNNDKTNSASTVIEGLMCDPTHYQKAYCNLVDQRNTPYQIQIPPRQYQYFPNNKFLGPLTILPDYCPIPTYQTYPMPCNDENTLMIPTIYGEQFTSNSRCLNVQSSQLTNKKIISSSACFKSNCNKALAVFQVMIKDTVFNCDFDGQVFNFYPGTFFECPKFASVCPNLICPANCSGKGKCKWDNLKESKLPFCECFDINDTSDGCYGIVGAVDDIIDSIIVEKEEVTPSDYDVLESTTISPSNSTSSSSMDQHINHTYR